MSSRRLNEGTFIRLKSSSLKKKTHLLKFFTLQCAILSWRGACVQPSYPFLPPLRLVPNLSFRAFSVTKEERNLPPFFSEEALLRNLAWMPWHLSTVQVQSNLREIDAHAASDVWQFQASFMNLNLLLQRVLDETLATCSTYDHIRQTHRCIRWNSYFVSRPLNR